MRGSIVPTAAAMAAALAVLSLDGCTQSVGIPGPPGPAGATGDPGAAGPRGDAGAGYTAYVASQDGGAASVVPMGTWVDIPGVSPLAFNTVGASATLDLLATGSMTGSGGAGSSECALRFVVDGTATGDPLYGNRRISVALNQWIPFALMLRTSLATAGSHSVKVQVARASLDGTPECSIDGAEYSQLHLMVTIR